MKKAKYLLIAILIIALFVVPSSLAFYFKSIESPLTTKLKVEYNSVFVRADIITYWIDKDNNVIGKTDWIVDESKLNSDWQKIDNYYYYKGTLSKEQIKDGIPTNNLLVDESLSSNDIANEDISDNKYTAKYKVVYELLEADNENNVLSSEEAWGITFAADGTPSKK